MLHKTYCSELIGILELEDLEFLTLTSCFCERNLSPESEDSRRKQTNYARFCIIQRRSVSDVSKLESIVQFSMFSDYKVDFLRYSIGFDASNHV